MHLRICSFFSPKRTFLILRLFLSAFLAQPFPLAGSNSFFFFFPSRFLLEHFWVSSLEIELFLLVFLPLLGRFFSLSLSLSLIRDNNLHDSIVTIMSHLSYLHAKTRFFFLSLPKRIFILRSALFPFLVRIRFPLYLSDIAYIHANGNVNDFVIFHILHANLFSTLHKKIPSGVPPFYSLAFSFLDLTPVIL